MKIAIFLLLLLPVTSVFGKPKGENTRIKLNKSQIQECDETGWVTLTAEQKIKLQKRTGVAPTRVRPVYDMPDGEIAEIGHERGCRVAIKTAVNEIKILHDYLVSDEVSSQKRKQADRTTALFKPSTQPTKEYPSFAIDSDGHLWKFISISEFRNYVVQDPKKGMIYFQMPSSMPSRNTVAAQDTLRQVSDYSKSKGAPFYVIMNGP